MNQKKKIPIKFPLLSAKDFYCIWAKNLQIKHKFLRTTRPIHLVQSAYCTQEESKAQERKVTKGSQQESVAILGPWIL